MKKFLCFLCVILLLPVSLVLSAEPQAVLSGPDRIHSREFFHVTLEINSGDVSQIGFTITYDTEDMLFSGMETDNANWEYRPVKNRFTILRKGENTSSDEKTVFTFIFRLRDVAIGTPFWVQLSDVTAKIGGEEKDLGTLIWEQTCARPISANNYLATLTLSTGDLQPEFRGTRSEYTVQVPYDVEAINITATARDPYASIHIESPELIPGGITELTVTVTAENGDVRVYRIAVTRAEKPLPPTEPEVTAPPATTSPETEPTQTVRPTTVPTEQPTEKPTERPTEKPTERPTEKPTEQPTEKPTEQPTDKPTEQPTEKPTEQPTEKPTEQPTEKPTERPTEKPTEQPTEKPTEQPTEKPTEQPTEKPTEQPTEKPTEQPTEKPTEQPTEKPTEQPTEKPTEQPTEKPTEQPTEKPTEKPMEKPTEQPTEKPTERPTEEPTAEPSQTVQPTTLPTASVAPTTESTEQTMSASENTKETNSQPIPLPGSDIDIPSWVYMVVMVAAVTGMAAVGILISDRKK